MSVDSIKKDISQPTIDSTKLNQLIESSISPIDNI